jgi:hypothetical protein
MTVKRTIGIQDLADELGLSVETIRRDVKRGAPRSKAGSKLFFDVPEFRQWRVDHEGKGGRPKRSNSPELDAAKLRKELALAEKYELQTARERGELMPAEEVHRWISDHYGTLRTRLSILGDELTPALEGRDAPERAAIINDRVRELLNELANAIGRMGEDVQDQQQTPDGRQ